MKSKSIFITISFHQLQLTKYLIMFLAFLLQSCDKKTVAPEEKEKSELRYRYYAKNNSGETAYVYLYRWDNSILTAVGINPSDSMMIDYSFNSTKGTFMQELYRTLDSAIILFPNDKKLVQTISLNGNRITRDTINNILSPDNYKTVKTDETSYQSTFTLTENDYLRAK